MYQSRVLTLTLNLSTHIDPIMCPCSHVSVVHVVLTKGKCDFSDQIDAYSCKILADNLMPSYDFYDFAVMPLDLPAG